MISVVELRRTETSCTPGTPVAVNVCGLPLARASALSVFTPGNAPNTHEACAQPSVPVLTVALLPPPTVPPPVTTLKVTGSLASGWGPLCLENVKHNRGSTGGAALVAPILLFVGIPFLLVPHPHPPKRL